MFPYEEYLRMDKFPHVWCAGCGNGIIVKSMIRAIHKLGTDKNKVVIVSGIGCSSRTPGYMDCNTLHTTHGRALAFATGAKLANPELTVVVPAGDGDIAAIGGNHFIHSARRNIDITCIVYNNYIYGMTGGQVSPTTPRGKKASTAPYGAIDPPFDICGVAIGAGASFVARGTVYHATHLEKLIEQGIRKKGFSVIEVLTPCPISYGRKNRMGTAVDMFRWFKENSITVERAKNMKPEDLKDKIIRGVLADIERPEYTEEYKKLVERVKER